MDALSIEAKASVVGEPGTQRDIASFGGTADFTPGPSRKPAGPKESSKTSTTKVQCPSDVAPLRSMKIMEAVVVPASPHRQDLAVSRVERSKRKARDVLPPRSPAQSLDDDESEFEASSVSDPSSDSDDDYRVTSDDDGASVQRRPKRPRRSSRCQTESSPRPSSRVLHGTAGSQRSKQQSPCHPRSTRRSVGSRPSHVPPFSDANLAPRRLSLEDVSNVVSTAAEKLLAILRGAQVDLTGVGDGHVAVADAQPAARGKKRSKSGRKRLAWTPDEDKQLDCMRSQGWKWWEIQQQFPEREKCALQQRWYSIRRARAAAPVLSTERRKRKCR